MIKKVLVLCAAMLFSANSHAFDQRTWTNAFTDVETLVSSSDYGVIGITCNTKTHKVNLTFGTPPNETIATPNSDFVAELRIDKGKVHTFNARTYSNSYTSGYVTLNNWKSLVNELGSGSSATVRYTVYGQTQTHSVKLHNDGDPLGRLIADCALTTEERQAQKDAKRTQDIERVRAGIKKYLDINPDVTKYSNSEISLLLHIIDGGYTTSDSKLLLNINIEMIETQP